MPKIKTTGIYKAGDRDYYIDKSVAIEGQRVHIWAQHFASAKEAEAALPSLIEVKRNEIIASRKGGKFKELVDEYLRYRLTKAKQQTVELSRYIINKHLAELMEKPVPEALSLPFLRPWYMKKASAPDCSPDRKNKVFAELRAIIERAWQWEYISSEAYRSLTDLCSPVAKPVKAKPDKPEWNCGDVGKFLEAIPENTQDKALFTLFCYLGCRLGEFIGLQWKCFDVENRAIRICQQVIWKPTGAFLTDQLKTNDSYRVDLLDQATFDLLLAYKNSLDDPLPSDYMFPSPFSPRRPLSRSEFRRRFYKYVGLSGVPRIVPHGVRHAKATALASVCLNAEEVAVGASFLGHSPEVFMSVYVNTKGVSQADLISRLNEKSNVKTM